MVLPNICLDAGHGGVDTGATAAGVVEASYVLRFSKSLATRLSHMWPFLGVSCTRTRSDESLTLAERAERATAHGSALLISLHCNAGPVGMSGAQAYVMEGDAGGYECAATMLGSWPILAMRRPVVAAPEGWRRRAYRVLSPHASARSAILLELGHLTAPEDVRALHARWVREQMFCAIALGIGRWLDLTAGQSVHESAGE